MIRFAVTLVVLFIVTLRVDAEPDTLCNSESSALAGTLLDPGEAQLWVGEWFSTDSDIEDNVYEILTVSDVDSCGFTYRFECRDIPYGPNARWSEGTKAVFRGPLQAKDKETGREFRLSIDPSDSQARSLETGPRPYEPVGCSPGGEGSSNEFVYRRATFRAGFDCARAVTAVELAICEHELIARGDFELTAAYRMIRGESSVDEAKALLASQRTWLDQRNSACVEDDDVVDDICLARIYSDRLVELARMRDPTLGTGAQLNLAFVMALLARSTDLAADSVIRLAMYPLLIGLSTWRADAEGILFESTEVKTRIVWPSDVDFRYSQMLYIGSHGTGWIARHIEPLANVEGLNQSQLWIEARGAPFMIRSDNGFESNDPLEVSDTLPDLVKAWLAEHPITEPMRRYRQ